MKKVPKEMQTLPWHVSHEFIIDRGDAYGVDDAKGMPVIPKLNVDREIMQLAAAAPDMLAALNAILPFCAKTSASEGGAAKYSASVAAADLVREAIAQATGATS